MRLDSGDLIPLSKSVRRILDDGGLADVSIFASGGLDEDYISEIVQAGAPIDGFGVGTSLTTSSDAPALDCAYKLQEYAGLARRKRSLGKATWPGRKQVWRRYGSDGRMAGASEKTPGWLRSGRAPRTILNACPSRCATSSRVQPTRLRWPRHWCG